jgi:AcrR family transcriptional regulator
MGSACEERPASGPMPYGPMSLSEMINCHVASLAGLCSQLRLYETVLGEHPEYTDGPHSAAGNKLLADVRGWLKIAAVVADDFELEAVRDRIEIIEKRMSKERLTNFDVSTEMRVLLQTVTAGLKNQLVYRYPRDKSQIFFRWKDDWAAVLQNFTSAGEDIRAAVDLWALGHATASVFQFMRVLERGLRVLARDVGITFDVQNWQNVIDQIESEIRQLGKSLPSGQPKNERLLFLSQAAKEFVYFKDGWRNYVSHGRGIYDEHQARSVMEHVRAFMMTLSSKLREWEGA